MDKLGYMYQHSPGLLRCGEVHPEQFRLLIGMSGVHSARVIMALEDHLVYGISRKKVCEKHSISTSYISTSLAKLQQLSRSVAALVPWYITVAGRIE